MRGSLIIRQQGYAAVEMILVLPVLLMFVGILSEFGYLYIQHTILTKAVQDGARWAITAKTGTASGIADTTEIKNLVVYGKASSGTNPVLDSFTVGNVTVNDSGDYVTVSATYPYTPLFTSIPYLTKSLNMNLNASAVMRK